MTSVAIPAHMPGDRLGTRSGPAGIGWGAARQDGPGHPVT